MGVCAFFYFGLQHSRHTLLTKLSAALNTVSSSGLNLGSGFELLWASDLSEY